MMNENISALLDDELEPQVAEGLLDRMRRDEGLRGKWSTFCVVGDALRGQSGPADDFTARIMSAIDTEPTVLSPVSSDRASRSRDGIAQRTMPLVASVMGVAAVGWIAYSLNAGGEPVAAQALAIARAPVVAAVSMPVRADDRLSVSDSHREYVFVHQALSGSGPMPGVTQYVRTVAEQPADAAQ